jgi:hypothetical protein
VTNARWGLLAFLLGSGACGAAAGPRQVVIHGTNYAFQAPRTVPAGPIEFSFANDGSVLHEVQFFRFRPDVSADQALRLMADGPVPDSLLRTSGAVLIAIPGATSHERLALSLTSGEVYGLLCEFRDADSLPPHSTKGMFGVITVE